MPSAHRRQRGFSIIEMMVAITIGLFLLAGAISVFLTSKRTYNIQDDLARIQENARFTIEQLGYDLRMAGYFGCADDLSEVYNHVNGASGGSALDTGNAVEGYEQGAAAWTPSGNTDVGSIVAGTDGITVRYLEPSDVSVTTPFMTNASANIKISQPNEFQQGDILAVADCESSDIMQVSGPTSGPDIPHIVHNTGNNTDPGNANLPGLPSCPGANAHCLSKVYKDDATVMRLVAYRYYIGADADGDPALFRVSLDLNTGGTPTVTGAPQQLVDGVENMQILYGVDTSGDRVPNTYISANAATGGVDLTTAAGWENVISVRLSLLFRSVEETAPEVDTATHELFEGTPNEVSLGPFNDRRRRRVFENTVLMRNLQTR